MKEKITQIILGTLILFVLGSLLYVAIKHPRTYPGYDIAPPSVYSPWPATQSSNCIKNPVWCY